MSKIKTSCKTCIFAQFDNDVQTGCSFGRLEKFKHQDKAKFDNEQNSFIIQSVCNTCRSEKWAAQHQTENLIAAVEREIQIDLDFVIIAMGELDYAKIIDRAVKRSGECINQKRIKPKNIVIVSDSKDLNYPKLRNTIMEFIPDGQDINIKVVKALDDNLSLYNYLDTGVQKCTSRFFATFEIDEIIPVNLIETFNTTINTDLKQIVMVKPYNKLNGLIIQKSLYHLMQYFDKVNDEGNLSIVEKVEKINMEVRSENNYINWDELWNHQKSLL